MLKLHEFEELVHWLYHNNDPDVKFGFKWLGNQLWFDSFDICQMITYWSDFFEWWKITGKKGPIEIQFKAKNKEAEIMVFNYFRNKASRKPPEKYESIGDSKTTEYLLQRIALLRQQKKVD